MGNASFAATDYTYCCLAPAIDLSVNPQISGLHNRRRAVSAVVREMSKVTLLFDDDSVKVVVVGKDIGMDSPVVKAILGKREGEEVYYVDGGVLCHVKIEKIEDEKVNPLLI